MNVTTTRNLASFCAPSMAVVSTVGGGGRWWWSGEARLRSGEAWSRAVGRGLGSGVDPPPPSSMSFTPKPAFFIVDEVAGAAQSPNAVLSRRTFTVPWNATCVGEVRRSRLTALLSGVFMPKAFVETLTSFFLSAEAIAPRMSARPSPPASLRSAFAQSNPSNQPFATRSSR